MHKIILVFLCLLAFPSLAQKIILIGKIQTIENKQPVEYANVSVWKDDKNPVTGAITKTDGSFKIENISLKNFILKVQFVGMETYTQNINITTGDKIRDLGLISLKNNQLKIDEINIEGKRAISNILIDKQVISTKQFQTAANGTGLDLLQKTSSVTINADGQIAMRGNEGLIVLINGVPSTRNPTDVLKQIPANLIEQIEIVTTPGAKYDADGKSGVINIITKQNLGLGWSGIANGLFAGANPLRYGADLTINYSATKFGFYIGGDYRRYDIEGYRVGAVRTLSKDSILTFLPSAGERNYKDKQHGIRAGFNYNFSANDVFNVSFYSGKKQTDRFANLYYSKYLVSKESLYFDNFAKVDSRFFNQNTFVRSGEFQTINADYFHIFPNKSKINLLALYEYSVLGGPLNNYDTDLDGSKSVILHEKTTENSPLNAWRLQTDYTLPLKNNNKLELGYSFRATHHKGDFNFERLNLQTNVFENLSDFSDKLDLTQNIHAAYFQYSKTSKVLSYNLGLRTELMDRTLDQYQTKQQFVFNSTKNNFWDNLFPSFQALWMIDKQQKIRLGYSKRIDRPVTKSLSPFKNHRHAETIEVGDPNLRPEISNVLELSYAKTWAFLTLNATTYYISVKDKIFRVNDIYSPTILLRNYTNAGSTESKGIEMNAEIKASKYWRFYLSGNIFDFDVKGEAFGKLANNNSLNFNANANTSIDISSKLKFQWDLNYVGATATPQGNDTDMLIANAGIKYLFNKNNASVGLILTNMFDSNRQYITTKSDDFYSSTNYIKYDRILQLNFSYRFNENSKAKTNKSEYGEKEF